MNEHANALIRADMRQLAAMRDKPNEAVQFITPAELSIFVNSDGWASPSQARRLDSGRAYCAVCCKPRRWVCDVRQFQVCLACIDEAEQPSANGEPHG